MSLRTFQAIDETLLLLSEARQRAERGAREAAADDAQQYLVDALEQVDRELLALHKRLMDDSLGLVEQAETQLALEAA
jgi:hypothetical protein